MREIRNSNGRLVCRIDETTGIIEIVHKGCKTLIWFTPNGALEITNTEAT